MSQTICKDCLLAEYTGAVQTGCKIGRLDKFKNSGRAKLEDRSYIIDGICNTCRHVKYKDRYSDPETQIRDEVRIRVDYILELDKIDRDELIFAACGIEAIRPTRVKIVLPEDSEYWIVQEIFGKYCKIPFNIIMIFEDYTEAERKDHIVGYCKNQYYIFAKFVPLHESIVDQLDRLINDDLRRIIMVKSDTLPVISKQVHDMLGGNKDKPIEEKIEELAEKHNRTDWITTWDKI